MIKKCGAFSGFFLLLLFCLSFSQAPDTLWTKVYNLRPDTVDQDAARSIQQTADGGYIVTGTTNVFANNDIFLMKLDAAGDTIWVKRYGGSGHDVPYQVQNTFDGGFIIAGYTRSTSENWHEGYLLKTDANGDSVWAKIFGGGPAKDNIDWFSSVYQTADSGYICGGMTTENMAGTHSDVWLVKTDKNGDSLWAKALSFSASNIYDEYSNDAIPASDGGYVMCGRSGDFQSYMCGALKTDGSGNLIWQGVYGDNGGGHHELLSSIVETSDGGYLSVGYSRRSTPTNNDVHLQRFNVDGDSLWAKRIDGGYGMNDYGNDIRNTSDGGFLAVGIHSYGAIWNERDLWFVKLDSNGDTLWTKAVGWAGPAQSGYSGQETSDGGYIAVGNIYSNPDNDAYIVKLAGEDQPPAAPYIYAEKFEQNPPPRERVRVYWHPVTCDTLGNPVTVDSYMVYGDDDPAYIPGAPELLATVADTFFEERWPAYGTNRYYLVFAVSATGLPSGKSNMGYAFWKPFNENASSTDKNWVSIPWHSEYSSVSDLTTDLSVDGDPLTQITNLRDDQLYESWTWDDLFSIWGGSDFSITSGRSYEMIAAVDTLLIIVGSNNPNGQVPLNENLSATDKNWVSIPYNAVYDSVHEITDEYSPLGNPLIQLTNLRDDQYYESWIWDDVFLMWIGVDFGMERGRGYEFVTVVDTTWDPVEYPNVAKRQVALGRGAERAGVRVVCGERVGRACHEAGVSHVVRCYLECGMDDVRFTAYRYLGPGDILTEGHVGSYVVCSDRMAGIGFNAGNFARPWRAGEEVVLEVSGTRGLVEYSGRVSFELDGGTDIQDLGVVSLRAAGSEGEVGVPGSGIPRNYSLGCTPNPVVRGAKVMYGMPRAGHVRISVYDVAGRCVSELVNGMVASGYHMLEFKDNALISGIYYIRMETLSGVKTEKVTVLK